MDLTTALSAAAVAGTVVGSAIVYIRKELKPFKKEIHGPEGKLNGGTLRGTADATLEKVEQVIQKLAEHWDDMRRMDARLLLTEKRMSRMFDEQNEKIDDFCVRLERIENVFLGGSDGQGSGAGTGAGAGGDFAGGDREAAGTQGTRPPDDEREDR